MSRFYWLACLLGIFVSCASGDRGPLADGQGAPVGDLLAVMADGGATAPDLPPVSPGSATACPACTDPATCCTEKNTRCYGHPDEGVVCTCPDLWDCGSTLTACEQELPLPTESSGGWSCSWTATGYSCSTNDAPETILPGWTCTAGPVSWTCRTAHPPTPCNREDGAFFWICTADNSVLTLTCTAKAP